MTNEERDLIARFIARVGGQPQAGGGFGSSVPATQAALPPIDPEADRFIGTTMNQFPEARYRITQMAVVQEAALAEAQNRIRRLEWELQQAQAQAQQSQQQSPRGAGLFGGLFGGGARQAPPAPQQGCPPAGDAQPPTYARGPPPQQGYPPQGYAQQPNYAAGPPPQPSYAPGVQPGMFQRQGSGFLGSALTTAAGVAGGMVAGNALMGLFEGGHGGGGFGGGGFGGGETVVNNYGDAASPWGGDAGGGGGGGDPFAGQGTDVDPNFDGGGGDAGGFDGGGFDSGGGGFDDSSSF